MSKSRITLTKRNDETYSEYYLRNKGYNAFREHKCDVKVSTNTVGDVLSTCRRLRNKLQLLNRRLLKIKAQNKALRAEIELLNHLLVIERLARTTEITVQMPEIKL